MVSEFTRSGIIEGDKKHAIWWANYEKEQAKIELEHDKHRLKLMEMLVKNITNSKHKLGISGIYRYITVPYLKIFRKNICDVYCQWNHDWSFGINLYNKRYYEIIKKVLENYDNANHSNSAIFREYE